jgi:ribosomal protein S21
MLKIEVGKGGIEKALKQYKSKVIRSRQLKELRERQEHVKPSAKKRKQKMKAKYVEQKFRSNQD